MSIQNKSETDHGWLEKSKALSTIIATIFIPIVIGYIGNNYSEAIKEREVQGRFVELAVEILRQQPSDETRNLRDWATRVVDNYSGIPFSDSTREDLIGNIPILSIWTSNNKTNTTTWTILSVLDQFLKTTIFKNAGNLKLKKLAYWSTGPEGEISDRARTLANRIDGMLRQIRGASYESGVDNQRAIKEMVTILLDGDKSVSDLAVVVDQNYFLLGENN